jgi:phenylalanyl-tRNA synthetase beta chain
MKRLGCKVEGSNGKYQITPPEFRIDLDKEVDFVEEFGRLNGYDHIPENLPSMNYAPLANDKNYLFEQKIAQLARTVGFSQCVNFGFTGSKYQAATLGAVDKYRTFGLQMDSDPVKVQNPLNEDMDVMRVSLIPCLLKNLTHNYRHGNTTGRLFETGFVFGRGPEGYLQSGRIGFVAWGQIQGLWNKAQDESAVFFDLKARVQGIFDKLLIGAVQFKTAGAGAPALLHPAQSASIFSEGRDVGFIGCLHPKWLADEKIRVGVAVGEIDLSAIQRGQPRTVKFKPVSKFPAVERDLAFVLPKTMQASDVSMEIKKTAGPLLQSIEVFDVFSGGNLPEGHVSVAYKMVFQNATATLNDEELTQLQNLIVANVGKKLSVKVR